MPVTPAREDGKSMKPKPKKTRRAPVPIKPAEPSINTEPQEKPFQRSREYSDYFTPAVEYSLKALILLSV